VSDWTWIARDVLLAAHDEQLQEHGGATGIRDEGLFDSALPRSQNLAAYGEPDAEALAKNHAFVDGNKRMALVALELFLELNGFTLVADDAQCVIVILSLASGAFSEDDLAEWIRRHLKPA